MFFNFFKKNKKDFFCGINFDKNGNFEIIELKKQNNSFIPSFYKKNNSEFDIKKLVKILKPYKNQITSNYVNVFLEDDNKIIKTNIKTALTIIGFKKIVFLKEKNILGIIFDNFQPYQKIIFYFTKNIIYIFETENFSLKNIEEIKNKKFKHKDIKKYLKNIKYNEIYVVGIIDKIKIEELKKIFKKEKINIIPLNIWNNFLSFYDYIPKIHLLDSYQYLDVLSITVPNLKKWPILNNKKNKDFKNKIKFLPKKTNFKTKNKKYKIKKQIFLPKNKPKLFLPKPKSFISKIKKIFNTKL